MLKLLVGVLLGLSLSLNVVSFSGNPDVHVTHITKIKQVQAAVPSFVEHRARVASLWQLRKATHRVLIVWGPDKEVIGSGSGVAISPTTMLTAKHIADMVLKNKDAKMVLDDGAVLTFIKADETRDVAVLAGKFDTFIHIGLTKPEIDSEVVAVGYPYGQGPVVTEGRVMGYKLFGPNEYMLTTSPISVGNSGGGLFQWVGDLKDGHYVLVGITVAMMGKCDNPWQCNVSNYLALSADLDTIKNLLKA